MGADASLPKSRPMGHNARAPDGRSPHDSHLRLAPRALGRAGRTAADGGVRGPGPAPRSPPPRPAQGLHRRTLRRLDRPDPRRAHRGRAARQRGRLPGLPGRRWGGPRRSCRLPGRRCQRGPRGVDRGGRPGSAGGHRQGRAHPHAPGEPQGPPALLARGRPPRARGGRRREVGAGRLRRAGAHADRGPPRRIQLPGGPARPRGARPRARSGPHAARGLPRARRRLPLDAHGLPRPPAAVLHGRPAPPRAAAACPGGRGGAPSRPRPRPRGGLAAARRSHAPGLRRGERAGHPPLARPG